MYDLVTSRSIESEFLPYDAGHGNLWLLVISTLSSHVAFISLTGSCRESRISSCLHVFISSRVARKTYAVSFNSPLTSYGIAINGGIHSQVCPLYSSLCTVLWQKLVQKDGDTLLWRSLTFHPHNKIAISSYSSLTCFVAFLKFDVALCALEVF